MTVVWRSMVTSVGRTHTTHTKPSERAGERTLEWFAECENTIKARMVAGYIFLPGLVFAAWTTQPRTINPSGIPERTSKPEYAFEIAKKQGASILTGVDMSASGR